MEHDDETIGESLRALTRFFVDEGTLDETLLRVCEMARALTPAAYVGITMLVNGAPRTGVFTDPGAPEIDEAQYRTGEGPCMAAFRDQRTYRIADTVSDARWPAFARAALGHGIHATLSVPLVARGAGIGALNLYAESPAAFTDADEKAVLVFAEQASIALANAQLYWELRVLTDNLNEAIKTREVISQAVGIVMATSAHSPDEAFQVLANASQRENRKVRDIAVDMVTRMAERAVRGNEPA